MTAATETKLTQVVSVAPAKLEDNTMLVSWSRRSTEKNPVKTEERFRGIVVPTASLALPDGATTSKFSALLQSVIYDLADKKFAKWAIDNMLVSEVDPTQFSLDAVIAYWAEEKKASQMDGAKITDWLKASKTLAALPEAAQKVWLSRLPKIAAPGYVNLFSQKDAASLVSKLHPEDLDHPAAVFVVTRCNTIISRESVQESF